MSAANFTAYPGMSNFRSPMAPQTTFTFTTPTQCSTLGTHRPCIQTMSPMQPNAPGVGASWQHSIPTTMPWVDMTTSTPQQQGSPMGSATVFTGMPFYGLGMPHPSGAEMPRRPKRRSDEYSSEGPLSKVHRCADQLANMRISPAQRGENNRTGGLCAWSNGTSSSTDHHPGPGSSKGGTSRAEQWERFRELESRLETDSEEPDSPRQHRNKTSPDGVYVSVANGVVKDLTKSSPILPRTVMEGINKPCMQVVLWQSPEALIRDISTTENNSTSSIPPSTTRTTSPPGHEHHHLSPSDSPAHSSNQSARLFYQASRPPSSSPQQMFNRQLVNNSSCSLSASPGFLKPLSSSTDSSTFSMPPSPNLAADSCGSYTGARGGLFRSRPFSSSGSGFNNNNIANYNNNNNNVMDMFDSLDDEMQL